MGYSRQRHCQEFLLLLRVGTHSEDLLMNRLAFRSGEEPRTEIITYGILMHMKFHDLDSTDGNQKTVQRHFLCRHFRIVCGHRFC